MNKRPMIQDVVQGVDLIGEIRTIDNSRHEYRIASVFLTCVYALHQVFCYAERVVLPYAIGSSM